MADKPQQPEAPAAEALRKEEIAELPRWAQVALAARCAFRAMPATGSEGDFEFWGDEAPGHVEAVDIAARGELAERKPASDRLDGGRAIRKQPLRRGHVQLPLLPHRR